MNSRTSLVLIAALLIAGGGVAFQATRSSLRHAPDSSSHAHQKSAKSETEEGRLEREDRFVGVNPALKKIIRHLELSIHEWGDSRPPYLHSALFYNEHRDFTRGKIAELTTDQIAALAAFIYEKGDLHFLGDYQKAIYFVWGSRDFAATRPLILKIAGDEAPDRARLAALGASSPNPGSDFYESACLGLAKGDLRKAWATVLADKDDPALKGLLNFPLVRYKLFAYYSATDPKEAWQLYLDEKDPESASGLLDCYAAEAPRGQDRKKLAAEFDRLAAGREQLSLTELTEFASPWLIEEPEQALDWFTARVDRKEYKHRSLLGAEEDPPDFDLRLKMELLDELYRSEKYRIPETVTVLQHLASGADEVLAARAVSQFLGSYMSPSDLPLLAVIPHFKSSQLRKELILEVARAVPAREYSRERYSLDMTFDHPNVCLDAVRALAAEMDLPDEVREQAEAAFREVEAKEAEKREAKKRGASE